jgi:hypothetical protein
MKKNKTNPEEKKGKKNNQNQGSSLNNSII